MSVFACFDIGMTFDHGMGFLGQPRHFRNVLLQKKVEAHWLILLNIFNCLSFLVVYPHAVI